MTHDTAQTQPGFFGPWVVRSAFVLAVFGWGVGFYGPSVYLHAVVERTAWPLALVSAAVTLHFLGGVLVIANLPRLHARFGLPVTTLAGSVVTAAGVMGWALAAQPWQLFAAALMSGMGWVTMGAVAVNAVVSPWYVRKRPTALATAYNGASIGGVIFSPLWVTLIAWIGFAGAAGLVGLCMIAVIAGLGLFVFTKTPQSLNQVCDGEAAPLAAPAIGTTSPAPMPGALLWRDRAFVTLAVGMAIGLFAQIGLLAHLFSLLAPELGTQMAGLVMGAATAFAVVGRSVAARLLLRTGDRRVVAAGGYAIQALGSVVLLLADSGQTGLILVGVALFGSGIGNATSIPPLIAQTDFAAKDVARVVALVVAMGQGTYAFAPAIFGMLQSVSGTGGVVSMGHNVWPFFVTAAGIQLTAGLVFLMGRRR